MNCAALERLGHADEAAACFERVAATSSGVPRFARRLLEERGDPEGAADHVAFIDTPEDLNATGWRDVGH